jgi:signal transduction histidine kinase
LATAASLAVDNARLLGRVRELAMAEDRERIAADLHDTVIQRLFATGLALDASRRLASPELGVRLDQAVADLDETIKQIRSTIFALEAPRLPGRGLRSEVVALATEAAATLGFEPRIRLDGPLDSAVHREVGDDVLAALREGLSNVARHAHATAVDIEVSLGGNGELMVCVTDDGRGPVRIERAGGRGLANLARRAEAHGGSLELLPGPGGHGARLTWHVAKPGQPPADA